MRAAATPTFRKLWGVVKGLPLPKGKYQLEIDNKWNVGEFDGEKHFVISQTNLFGGKNLFLSICYIVVGLVSLIAAVASAIRRFMRP